MIELSLVTNFSAVYNFCIVSRVWINLKPAEFENNLEEKF